MRSFAPMTFIVILGLVACLVGGLVILWSAARKKAAATEDSKCARCGTRNSAAAKFCAHCGSKLGA